MAPQESNQSAPSPPNEQDRPTPQTDPTNPLNQESVGKWVAAERSENEPGTERAQQEIPNPKSS